MKKNIAKQLVMAAVLTSWLASPVLYAGAQDYVGGSRPNGGAIDNTAGNTVTVEDGSNFLNNSSTAESGGGGAIYSQNQGTINIGNYVTFDNNKIQNGYSAGGAIAAWGASQVTIGTNATFTNNGSLSNTSSSAFGGAIYIDTDWTKPAELTVGTTSNFTGNHAGYGGALYLGSTTASFGDGAEFKNNEALQGSGGAIYAFGGHAPSWAPSGYEGNLVGNDVTFGSVTFDNNQAKSYGGAIFNAAQASVAIGSEAGESVFSNNKAGADGGAIYNYGINGYIDYTETATEKDTATITLNNNVKFDNNQAQGNGGAIFNYVDDQLGTLTADEKQSLGKIDATAGNLTFINNGANKSGGAIYNTSKLQLGSANFGLFTADADGNITSVSGGNHAGMNGGAIANVSGIVTSSDAINFAGNSANQGGAFSNTGEGGLLELADGSSFVQNNAVVGGAISTVDTGSGKTVIGNDVKFIGNTAQMQGGAVHNQRATTEIGDNAKFYNNTAIGYGGGAVYQDTDGAKTSLTIGSNAEFKGNKTQASHGGAVMNYGASTNDSSIEIGQGAKFENNSAAKNGGAVANFGAETSVGSGAEFKDNTANGNGGAVYNADFNGKIANMTISGDTQFTGNKATGDGGAIYNAAKNLVFDTTAGDISFAENTDKSGSNDIYAAAESVTNITGSNNVTLAGGLITETDSDLNITGAGLVIEDNAVANISGNLTADSSANITNKNEMNLSGKTTLNGGSELLNTDELKITGQVVTENSGKIVNNGNVTVSGNGSELNVNFDQKDKDSTLVIGQGSKVTVTQSGTNIDGGTVIIEDRNALIGELAITEAVKLQIDGGSTVIDGTGLIVGENGHIVNGSGSMNLAGDYLVKGGILGSSVIIKNGSINSIEPEGPLTIKDKILTLSDNATSDNGYVVESDGTLKLSPSNGHSVTLAEDNVITGNGEVLVNEVVITEQVYDEEAGTYTPNEIKYGVGTINIANDNSGFNGNFLQKMGNVIVQAGAKFFGGTNTVQNGALTLNNGAILPSEVNVTTGTDADGKATYGTVNLYNEIESTITDDNRPDSVIISADDIANGNDAVLTYLNADESDAKKINITNGAGLGLFNQTIVDGDITLQSDKGVRSLTLGNGSGLNAENITLGADTKLTYKDNAYIRDDSNVSIGANASLNFENNTTNIDYKPVISSEDDTAAINKSGNGSTVISSSLENYTGSVNVTGGKLDLANAATAKLNNITAANSELHLASDVSAAGNVAIANAILNAEKSLTADGSLSVTNGSNVNVQGTLGAGSAVINGSSLLANGGLDIKNDISITDSKVTANNVFKANDAVVSGENTVLAINGTSTLNSLAITDAVLRNTGNMTIAGDLTLNSSQPGVNPTLNLMSGGTNVITAENTVLNSNVNIMFDVNPATNYALDGIKTNTYTDNGNQLIVGGINFTTSPRDAAFAVDASNFINSGDGNVASFGESTFIANTQMGRYLMSTGAGGGPVINASLFDINPQMYRGQVATLSQYANQLAFNNIILDHAAIVSGQYIAQEENANRYAAANPLFGPYQYSKKDGGLWYKAYGNFERISMTKGLSVGNNAYGAIVGGDFPLINLKDGWKLIPTAYIAYNGGHQTFNGVSLYQNGAQLGGMATAYKGNFFASLLAYGGGYANDMNVNNATFGNAKDTTGNWFAGTALKTAYNIHLPKDFILQPTGMISYNIFGNQNYGSNFGTMSMNTGFLNGINLAPGLNLIWNKETFSIYGTAQMVYNIMGGVDGRAGNVDLGYLRMRHSYFEYGLGVMKKFKDRYTGYLQFTIRNGGRTGIGFQGGISIKVGK